MSVCINDYLLYTYLFLLGRSFSKNVLISQGFNDVNIFENLMSISPQKNANRYVPGCLHTCIQYFLYHFREFTDTLSKAVFMGQCNNAEVRRPCQTNTVLGLTVTGFHTPVLCKAQAIWRESEILCLSLQGT